MSSALTNHVPPPPRLVADTDLSLGFMADLAIKTIYAHRVLTGQEIADALKLPFTNVVDQALEHLRRERLVEIKGAEGLGEASRQYVVTRLGGAHVHEVMDVCGYVGPAPVTLDAYIKMVHAQTQARQTISAATLANALAHLVLSETVTHQLGAAVNGARSVFLFGNTGNGKTSIGLSLGTLLPGAIWIPFAITVQGQVIQIFDPLRHRVITPNLSREDAPLGHKSMLNRLARTPANADEAALETLARQRRDERWRLIRRPLIVGGGELTLQNLDLIFDPREKCYHAPQQLKANGGVFLLDDLGRQAVSPRQILNRWIVPLEKRVDYLQLATGHRFQTPFDVFVVFATNLNPRDLVDESFLRRIRSKIQMADPTWDQLREIFKREAAKREIAYSEQVFQHLVAEHYLKPARSPRGSHPRDVLDALVDVARFRHVAPAMTKSLLDAACKLYFLREPED